MPLPQNHAWQVDLRSWLAGLTVSDFDCGLPGLSYDDAWLTTPDEVYRLWLTFENSGRAITGTDGIRIAPEKYLLSSIERDGGVYMSPQYRGDPGPQTACLSWMYHWDWQGNPYHNDARCANRALVSAIVDMMMTDNAAIIDDPDGGVKTSNGLFSQTYCTGFAAWSYAYHVAGHLLPPAVQDAYEVGLARHFEALEKAGPNLIGANLDVGGIIGMYYAGEILGGDHPERAVAYCAAFLNKALQEPGYIDHGNALDSYQGISLYYLVWAAHATGYPMLADALEKISVLKGYLTLKDTRWIGPSSFATSTAWSTGPEDQYWYYGRDMSISILAPSAKYTRYTGRNVASYHKPFGVPPDEAKMRSDLAYWSERNSKPNEVASWGLWGRTLDVDLVEWRASSLQKAPPVMWDAYPGEGFYSQVIAEADAVPPFEQPGDFIKQFGDEFVIWKLSGFGGIIHVGHLSWWDDNVKMPGFSGGSLCALWTAETGVALLGRQRGYAGSTPDTLDNMPTWAVQHVWGVKDGLPYSSGRERDPEATVIVDRENAMVQAKGLLSGAEPSENSYVRRFDIKGDGVQVTLEVNQSGFSELWEAFPFYLGENEATDGQIQFLVDGVWIDGTTDVVEATAAQIERDGYAVQCVFGQPERVRLSDEVWTTTYQVKSRIRSVMIDVLERGETRYTFSGAYRESLVKV